MGTTGMAIVTLPQDFSPVRDVFKLLVQNVSTFHASAAPYQGRYPCGSLYYKGTWWYGTYSLENPTIPPNPPPNCGNWCVQGPFCGFRWSTLRLSVDPEGASQTRTNPPQPAPN